MAKKPGLPKHLQAPALPKYVPKPKVFTVTASPDLLRVRFGHVDVGGPWCLTAITAEHHADLLKRVRAFEQMSCSAVFAPGSDEGKVYEVEKIPNTEATKRLNELEYDDQTEIARLRISGQRRLYGFLPDGGPDFYVLWWDPLHEVWPSVKKHT